MVYRSLLSLCALLALCAPTLAGHAPPAPTRVFLPVAQYTNLHAELVALINAGRAADGCPAAGEQAGLSAAAQAKSDDLAAGRGVLLGDFDYYAAHGYPVTTDVADVIVGAAAPADVLQRLASAPGQGPLRWCPDPAWRYDIGVGFAMGQDSMNWTIAVSARGR